MRYDGLDDFLKNGSTALAKGPVALIFVEDLVDAIIGVIGNTSVSSKTIELDDGTPGGYDWPSLARLAGQDGGRGVPIVRRGNREGID